MRQLELEMAASVLAGKSAGEPVRETFQRGLLQLSWVTKALSEPIRTGLRLGTSRGYVTTQLPHQTELALPFSRDVEPWGYAPRRMRSLAVLKLRTGKLSAFFVESDAAEVLEKRTFGDVDAAYRIILAIERARKKCYCLAEEGSRWL